MKLLQFLSNAFINTFGITQPSERSANRAAWFIVILLVLVIALVFGVAILILHGIYGH
jgi:hypothetical protein